MIKCTQCPLRRFGIFEPFSREDEEAMLRLKAGELVVAPGTTLLREGSKAAQLYTVLSGMGVRYKLLSDGQRQVVNFVLPGDFVGLQAGVMDEMRHSVESVSDMRLCVFDRLAFFGFMQNSPERAFDLTWLAAIEEHLVAEALTSVGQQPASTRVAWALLRLFRRAAAVGLEREPGRVPMPFRQQDLADAMGLSLVHTNRTLRDLRERGLATWQEGELTVPDLDRLATAAGMEDSDGGLCRPLL